MRRTRSHACCTRASDCSVERSFRRPTTEEQDAAVGLDQPCRQTSLGEPLRRGAREHDRSGARDVRFHAGRRGNAHRPPRIGRGTTRRRVDDVVQGTTTRVHRRTDVPEVASPPPSIVTFWPPGSSIGARWSSAIFTCQPPGRPGPPTDRSPPSPTTTPTPVRSAAAAAARSAHHALAVAPRSISTPCGTRTVARFRSTSMRCQPGTARTIHA